MKVIQTAYDGYLFRSRLEARWAVFFNSLGINWEYEKEGFEFKNGRRYFPDFWLPEVYARNNQRQGIWLEIKGINPTEIEEYKCHLLEEITSQSVFLAIGIPPGNGIDGYGIIDFPYMFSGQAFCSCYHCGSIKIDDPVEINPCQKCGDQTDDQHSDIKQAIIAAKRADF